ncbi:hypothetical protein [Microbispora sp. NPDC046933]|uniref:hypothetical protein n=1 Tax=Microbispora sp. NPDC046933 TaxID=3155618 RepID=UPI0033EADADC
MAVRRAGPVAALTLTVVVVAAAWVSWFLGGLTFADAAEGSYLLTNSAQALTFTAFGALVLAYRSGHRIGLLFVVYGACYTLSVACLGLLSGAVGLPQWWARAVELLGITVWIPAPAVCLPLIIQLFPDGRPLSRRWRPLALATLAVLPLTPVLTLPVAAGIAEGGSASGAPILPAAAGEAALRLTPVFVVADALVLLASLGALGLRTRRSRGAPRLQLMWLLWAVGLFVALNVQRIVTTDGPVLFLLTLPLIPAAVTVAILRHRLYDIELIVNRSLVYAVLTLGVVMVYLGIVAALSALAQDRLSATPLIATAVIALAFAPARSAVQSVVDRVMYGQRRDPAAAAARVGLRLGAGLDGVLRAVCEALRLPYAAVSSDGRLVATYGRPPQLRHIVSLEVAEGPPADLLVGLRAGESRLSGADRRALGLLAPRSAWPCRRCVCRSKWASPASASWPRGRRNAGGCAATCTTASARCSPR